VVCNACRRNKAKSFPEDREKLCLSENFEILLNHFFYQKNNHLHWIKFIITRCFPESKISHKNETTKHQDDHDHDRKITEKNDDDESWRVHQSLTFQIINKRLSFHVDRYCHERKSYDVDELPLEIFSERLLRLVVNFGQNCANPCKRSDKYVVNFNFAE
jgi:hypothetical protein